MNHEETLRREKHARDVLRLSAEQEGEFTDKTAKWRRTAVKAARDVLVLADDLRAAREALAKLADDLSAAQYALETIARRDDLVEANKDAFSIYAYRRCQETARAALAASATPGGDQ